MLTNYHTHSTFCDGKDTPEEMVLKAISKGFDALGFSGHGFTKKDSSFCMRDTAGYMAAVRELKEKYGETIQIYLGVEEDLIYPANRNDFDYIIGSSHYVCKDGAYYSVDGSLDHYEKCISLFDGDLIRFAHAYYEPFCSYIKTRMPDIIGHFDLITKYDEQNNYALMHNREYQEVAAFYMREALRSACIFEVNTGAIARGMRTGPYPSEELLYVMRREDAKLILSSDCHDCEMLEYHFTQTKQLLRDIGFRKQYVLLDGNFKSVDL